MKNTISKNVENRKQTANADNKKAYRQKIENLNKSPKDPTAIQAIALSVANSVLRKIESVNPNTAKDLKQNMLDDLVSTAIVKYYEIISNMDISHGIDIEKPYTITRKATVTTRLDRSPKEKTVETSILREMCHAVRYAVVQERTPVDTKYTYVSIDENPENPVFLRMPALMDIDNISDTEKVTKILASIQLSPTEKQIVTLKLKGLSNKDIADKLNIKPPTVCRHFQRIRAKYNNACTASLKI